LKLVVKNLNETITFSRKLANCCAQLKSSFVIYLIGELGVGKTALAQGFIQYFGFEQVKSPTYSLVESYENKVINIHHMDCYRLNDPEELEYIGQNLVKGLSQKLTSPLLLAVMEIRGKSIFKPILQQEKKL
jgi:tRNA threonylcarbamoyladenosine biosynthesis protein TsaE